MSMSRRLFHAALAMLVAGVLPCASGAQAHSSVSYVQTVTRITIGANGVTLSSTPNPSFYKQPVTFTATVPGTPLATGAVQFVDGTNVIGTAQLDGTATATFTTNALSAGTHPITAQYQGDDHYYPASSAVDNQQVILVPLTLAINPATVTMNPGATQTFTLTASRGLDLSLSTGTLPDGIAVTYSDPVVTPNANGGTTSWTATMTTGKFQKVGAMHQRTVPIGGIAVAALLAPFFFLRRRLPKSIGWLVLAVAMFSGVTALSGCGTSGWFGPPAGTFPYTVTVSSSLDGATASATANVTIN